MQDESNQNKLQSLVKEKMNEYMKQKMDLMDEQKKESKKLK